MPHEPKRLFSLLSIFVPFMSLSCFFRNALPSILCIDTPWGWYKHWMNQHSLFCPYISFRRRLQLQQELLLTKSTWFELMWEVLKDLCNWGMKDNLASSSLYSVWPQTRTLSLHYAFIHLFIPLSSWMTYIHTTQFRRWGHCSGKIVHVRENALESLSRKCLHEIFGDWDSSCGSHLPRGCCLQDCLHHLLSGGPTQDSCQENMWRVREEILATDILYLVLLSMTVTLACQGSIKVISCPSFVFSCTSTSLDRKDVWLERDTFYLFQYSNLFFSHKNLYVCFVFQYLLHPYSVSGAGQLSIQFQMTLKREERWSFKPQLESKMSTLSLFKHLNIVIESSSPLLETSPIGSRESGKSKQSTQP